MEKIILTDVDGVLLDWDSYFDRWMKNNKYKKYNENFYEIHKRYKINSNTSLDLIKKFNKTSIIGNLSAFRDSVSYVKKLSKLGYKFHCITSLSRNRNSIKLRNINLYKVFGKECFEKIICLDTAESKDEILKKYRNTGYYWIEDKYENALSGLNLGLKPILLKHKYANKIKNDKIIFVDFWKDIYSIIKNI